jgi:hypothetical protein
MSRPTIYFAHPISLYGTDVEERAIATLEAQGFDVVNPSDRDRQEACGSDMTKWAALAASCDRVAAMPFPSGAFGAGVVKEVEAVLAQGKKAFQLNQDGSQVAPILDWPGERRLLSVDETRAIINPFREARKAAGLSPIPVRGESLVDDEPTQASPRRRMR